MQRRQQQRVLGRDALGHGDAAHLVDVALAQQQVGLAVVGAERAALGPVVAHERQQVAQVARVRRLAQQHPGALAALLERLGERRRLVVGRDARGEVGVQLRAVDARRVSVDALALRQRDLRELGGRARDHGREVHHLGQAQHPVARQDLRQVGERERRPRRLERTRRHARRREREHVHRQPLAGVEEPVDALRPERVGELVRVAHDRRRPARDQQPRQLADHQLGRLDVHVRVDEPRATASARARRCASRPRTTRSRRSARRRWRRRPRATRA